MHRSWVSQQVDRRASEQRARTESVVRSLYSGQVRVTRHLVDTELTKLGLSLKNPIVRDAFYEVRAEQWGNDDDPRGQPDSAGTP